MICKICGRTVQNEEANFCEYCGASFRPGMDNRVSEGERLQEATVTAQGVSGAQPGSNGSQGTINPNSPWQASYANPQTNGQNPNTYNMQHNSSYGKETVLNSEKPMTFGNWLAVMLMVFIPFIGLYAFLALLVFWAFGKNTPPTKKNWARASLVFFLIVMLMFSMLMSMTGGAFLTDPTSVLNGIYGK